MYLVAVLFFFIRGERSCSSSSNPENQIVEEGIKTLRRENNKIVEEGIKKIEEGNKIEKVEG